MGRPVNWAPLAGSDPIPGEPEAISGEARRLRDMAVEMRSQISRLRSIGDDDNQGLYADKLRISASDLAGKLEKTVGRYERVAGELSSWSPQLSQAQDESVRALQRARAAEAARLANMVEATPRPGDPPPSPAEMAADRRRQSVLDEASQDLAAARRQLEDAVEAARVHGGRHADRIREAIDDDVADSWWDNFKDLIDHNAGWIKVVSDKLSWIATGLAVVALFIPGVNIVAWAAIGLTAVALAGHSALAASGNGSWGDVALDVFALATFGAGRLAVRGLRAVQAATRAAGARAAGRAAEGAALRSSRAARTIAGRTLSRRSATAAQRRHARRLIDTAKRDAQDAGTRAAREVREAPLAGATQRDVMRAGNHPGAARTYNDITSMRTRFPGDEGVAHASRRAELYRNTHFGAWAGSSGVDVVDKGVSFADSYNNAKGHFTKQVGSTW